MGCRVGASIYSYDRTARYDDNGRLIAQHITKPDGTFDYDLVYAGTTTTTNTYDVDGGVDESGNPVIIQQTTTTTGAGYDGAGNVLGYQVSDSSGVTSSYNFTQALFEGYKESSVSGTRSDNPGQGRTTTSSYDINGHLISVTGNDEGRVARSFINDTNGIILQQSSGDTNAPTSITRQIVANGQVYGSYGFAQPSGTLTTPAINFNNLPPGMVLSASTYDAGFQPINSGYPSASVGSYLVQTGDTLQSIAQSAYGDRQLWFVIAQANGLMSDADLKVGMSLTIPSKVGSVHNTSDTFKPYNPGELIGDTAPTLPVPQNDDDDCGFMGQLIMIVVAVVVTYLTAGAATGVWASVFGAGSTAATVAGAATAAALGSIASQVVGNALGIVDGFSWKAVALAAIGGGVGAGFGGDLLGTSSGSLSNEVLRAVIKNAVTQGIGVATGLQDSFDWRGVAAAGVGAGVSFGVGNVLGNSLGTDTAGRIATQTITGLASGIASAAARGGRVSIGSIAADAFGNALGGAFNSSMSTPSPASQGAAAGSGGSSYINGLDLDGDYSGGSRFSAASRSYAVADSVIAASDGGGDGYGGGDEMYGGSSGNPTYGFGGGSGMGLRPGGGMGLNYGGVRAPEVSSTAAITSDDAVGGLNDVNGLDLQSDLYAGGRRMVTSSGDGLLNDLQRAGFKTEAERRGAYGQLIRTGQLTEADFTKGGTPVLDPGREIYLDTNDFTARDRRVAGSLIANESGNRAAREAIKAAAEAREATTNYGNEGRNSPVVVSSGAGSSTEVGAAGISSSVGLSGGQRAQAHALGVYDAGAGAVEGAGYSFGIVGTPESRAAWAIQTSKAAVDGIVSFAKDPSGSISGWWDNLTGDDPAAIRQATAQGAGIAMGVGGGVALGRLQGAPLKNGTVTIYRVDDAAFAPRISTDDTIPTVLTRAGDERALFINIDQPLRAQEFALVNRGGNATITAIKADASILEKLRATSVYDRSEAATLNPTAPLKVDITKAPDQFGLRTSEQIQMLRNVIHPSTVRIIDPKTLR